MSVRITSTTTTAASHRAPRRSGCPIVLVPPALALAALLTLWRKTR